MITSLQGHFTNYSATFTNVNPLGDERLSLLDELVIHELIRNVRIYAVGGGVDDGVLDFLANDRKDASVVPDALYDSRDLARRPVEFGDFDEDKSTAASEIRLCSGMENPETHDCEV